MFKPRNLGLVLAGLVTALAVSGAATLIALDFVGVEGLAGAWSALAGWVWHGASSTKPAEPLGTDWRRRTPA